MWSHRSDHEQKEHVQTFIMEWESWTCCYLSCCSVVLSVCFQSETEAESVPSDPDVRPAGWFVFLEFVLKPLSRLLSRCTLCTLLMLVCLAVGAFCGLATFRFNLKLVCWNQQHTCSLPDQREEHTDMCLLIFIFYVFLSAVRYVIGGQAVD